MALRIEDLQIVSALRRLTYRVVPLTGGRAPSTSTATAP